MTTSLEQWPNKAKEAPSAHEVRLALLYTNANLNIGTMRERSTKIVEMLSQRNVGKGDELEHGGVGILILKK